MHERVGKMQERVPPELRWSIAMRDPLPCVACAAPMETLALFEVPVDRCRGHGIWFDVDEMAVVLLRSQQAVKPPATNFTELDEAVVDGTFIAAHVTAEAASAGLGAGLEVAEVAAAGAEAAGGVAGGVLEAVLELIGGILS